MLAREKTARHLISEKHKPNVTKIKGTTLEIKLINFNTVSTKPLDAIFPKHHFY